MYYDKLISERRSKYMEKFVKKYGVIILLYLVIICGIILLNERCKLLNQKSNETVKIGQVNK